MSTVSVISMIMVVISGSLGVWSMILGEEFSIVVPHTATRSMRNRFGFVASYRKNIPSSGDFLDSLRISQRPPQINRVLIHVCRPISGFRFFFNCSSDLGICFGCFDGSFCKSVNCCSRIYNGIPSRISCINNGRFSFLAKSYCPANNYSGGSSNYFS